MSQKSNLKNIYIDASPILNLRMSGIGHLTLRTIQELAKQDEYNLKLLVPMAKTSYIKHWGLKGVGIVKIPLPSRIWNRIPSFSVGLPIDLFLKKGLFIFPNFRKWPLIKSKSITYIHDISFELFPQFTEEKNLKMLKKNVPRWINESTSIVTDSNASRDEIINQYKVEPDKIKAIYCGVDGSEFKPIDKTATNIVLEKYHIEKEYMMFLSSLEPRKNIERILDSLLLLSADIKHTHSLLLVGGMSWRNEGINKKIEHLRKNGWTIIKPDSYVPDEDIPALLTGASLLLHPALHEGFGIPAVEAMSCGTPVITSNIPVMREVCGDAALFVDPYSPAEIAEAIKKLLLHKDVSEKLTKHGFARAKNFTWEKSTKDLVKEIESINKGIII